MPRAKRICRSCDVLFQPHSEAAVERGTCATCFRMQDSVQARDCGACGSNFSPPKSDRDSRYCASCVKASAPKGKNPYIATNGLPREQPGINAPMKQVVLDIETFGLERGFGVAMVVSMLIHGDGKPKLKTFTLRDFKSWPNKRSDDSALGAAALKELADCHIVYAHNGHQFDIPFLNSIALKYGMPRLTMKIVDPVWKFRRKFRIGSNALGSIAQFLNLGEQKMPVTTDTWRRALLDNDSDSWNTLVERCESDVRVLNEVASKIASDIGKIDYTGSSF